MRYNERGAIIIHVAIALMALLCFVGIVLDQGAFYLGRRQAQNSADAGALGGAMELLVNPGGNADATIAAKALANQNVIWSQAAGDSNINVSVPQPCPDGSPTGCISVLGNARTTRPWSGSPRITQDGDAARWRAIRARLWHADGKLLSPAAWLQMTF